jgi:hypothetical protein
MVIVPKQWALLFPVPPNTLTLLLAIFARGTVCRR